MRAWPNIVFSLLIGAAIVASSTVPAVAKQSTNQIVISANGTVRVVSHPAMSSFFPLTNGVVFPSGTTVNSRFGRFSAPTPGIGYFVVPMTGSYAAQADTSPHIIVLNAGVPQTVPNGSPTQGKTSVETMPNGVQIVRGPGSHHLLRY